MFKRILCAILAGLTILPLAACSESEVNNSGETNSSVQSSPDASPAEAEEETVKFLDDLPETMDFGGQEIRFIVEEGGPGGLTERSIYVEEDTGDVVDSAIFKRNMIVEDRLKIGINLVGVTGSMQVAPLVRTSVTSGTNDYDIVGLYQYYGAGFASEGMLLNLNHFEYNDFDREYWGSMYIDAMSYKDKTFWATGDLALRYTSGLYVTTINDTLWNQYYPDVEVYDLVDEGAWTIDKLYEYSSAVYLDANADGKADVDDTFGFALNTEDPIDGMCAGMLVEFGKVDEEGNPYIALNNERTFAVYDKLYNLLCNNPGFIKTPNDGSSTTMNKFNEGRYMITVNKLYDVEIYLREMEDNYKIIPLPKFDENQEYYNTRIHDSVTLFAVPITVESTEAISATLEALASESYRLVSPAYYETALKVKFTRDSDSGRMIDLIASHVSTDFVTLYSNLLSNINHFFRGKISERSQSIASSFRSTDKLYTKIMKNLLDKLDKIEN